MVWILIFWLQMDRGGGPAAIEFTTEERCKAAGEAIFAADKYRGYYPTKHSGNYICVLK